MTEGTHGTPMSKYTQEEVAAICRMQIELVSANSAAFFPGQRLADVLDLHFILLHLFLADAEGRALSVSELSRALGLSRASVRRRLKKLMDMGWATQRSNGDVDNGYALSAPSGDLTCLLRRKSKIIVEAARGVAKLAS